MTATAQVSGGDRLANRLRQLRERVGAGQGVLVGVPKAAGTYEDGTKTAVVAAVHEFGSAARGIPERSFLRAPLRSSQDEFITIFRRQLPMVVQGQLTMFQLLSQIGARAASTSQEAIAAGISPANAPSTIARKGSATPLVDTGHLRGSITYVVEGEE